MFSGIYGTIFSISMFLLLASPVVVIIAVIYFYLLEISENKNIFKLIEVSSIIISPLLMSAYEGLTEGLGFRLLLIYFSKWIGVVLCASLLVYHI